jgi:hypothetical protein
MTTSFRTIAIRILTPAMIALAITIGVLFTQPASAQAMSANCGGGRCTVYFNKGETAALAQGRIAPPPAALPWQLKASYYALLTGHRFFAQQYANRGWCSAFRISMWPWEGQGYDGYRC